LEAKPLFLPDTQKEKKRKEKKRTSHKEERPCLPAKEEKEEIRNKQVSGGKCPVICAASTSNPTGRSSVASARITPFVTKMLDLGLEPAMTTAKRPPNLCMSRKCLVELEED